MRHLIEQLDIVVYDGEAPWLREIDEDLLHHVMGLLGCESYEELLDFDASLLSEEAYANLDITEDLLKKIKGFVRQKLWKYRTKARSGIGQGLAMADVGSTPFKAKRRRIKLRAAALQKTAPKGGSGRQMPDKPGKATTRYERVPKKR